MRATVKLRKRGQVTIPGEIREAMDLKENDLLEIDVLAVSRGE